MRTLLYTGFNPAYRPLADITVPRMREYAKRHGMDFTAYDKPLIDVLHGIYWTGVCGALEAFKQGYDRAIYLDVDQVVTNFDCEVPVDWVNGFHASRDWGSDAVHSWQFSACGFFAWNSMSELFQMVLDLEPEWRAKPFPEQGPLQYVAHCIMKDSPRIKKRAPDHIKALCNELGYTSPISIHPRRVFNAVPDQVAPGNVPECWQPGDWCAHLTMVPIERRVEIAREILSQL